MKFIPLILLLTGCMGSDNNFTFKTCSKHELEISNHYFKTNSAYEDQLSVDTIIRLQNQLRTNGI